MDSNTIKWLTFTGTSEDYPAWSTKFTVFMQTKGLYKSLLGREVLPPEIAPLEEATAAQRNEWQAQVEQRTQKVSEINEKQQRLVLRYIALYLPRWNGRRS